MPVRAVLFDAGDTLFRLRTSVGAVYAATAARHGVTVDPDAMEARFRTAFPLMPPLAFPGVPPEQLGEHEFDWWSTLVTQVFAGVHFVDFEAFYRDLFDHFAAAASWQLFPDTQPALAALHARGLRLGVVSNFDGRLGGICDGLGLSDFFATIVVSGRAGAAKPDPRIFATALERLGVAPADALHVGDSEREDIAGARAAGLKAILVKRNAAPSSADRISDLRDIVRIL